MSGRKNFPVSMIINQIIETIESFTVDTKSLVTEKEKRVVSTKLIETVSRLNSFIAFQPVPFPDIILLTPIQVSMVLKISDIYGKKPDTKLIYEIISTVLKGITARAIAKTIVKFLPFVSTPVYLFAAHVVTQGIGIAAVRAFENKDDFNIADVKDAIEDEYNKPEIVNIFISPVYNSGKSLSMAGISSHKDLRSIQNQTANTFVYIPHNN